MLRIVAWHAVFVAIELLIALVMLGAWVVEGRRRAEEIDRLRELWRRSNGDHGTHQRPTGGSTVAAVGDDAGTEAAR